MTIKQLTSNIWAVVGVPQGVKHEMKSDNFGRYIKIGDESYEISDDVKVLGTQSSISEEDAAKCVDKLWAEEGYWSCMDYECGIYQLSPLDSLKSLCTLHEVKETDLLILKAATA